ncbi:hypothetical protein SAMN05660923_01648 [Tepidimicrobium xylanilyticum]|uniref:Uncharacterized protein n=1 Tax=Tepidimicrobium xylanilyticum TaxID=1123352 RepID=A0A1H2YKR8_9FIRM|nr:hypothetical protein SAMN05660923_01648 [Tepidimicrobium xylanilyticum]
MVEDINYIKSQIEKLIANFTEEEKEQLIISYIEYKEKSN